MSCPACKAAETNPHEAMVYARAFEVLSYCPETGLLVWRKQLSTWRRAGDTAGCPDERGYITVGIDRKIYKAHRLAWLLVTGEWPKGAIDHINGDKSDNRWSNLRVLTLAENMENQRVAHKRSNGLLGTAPSGSRWASKIFSKGKSIHLGTFATAQEAHAAYVDAKRRLHDACTL